MTYRVVLIEPAGYAHSGCLVDACRLLSASLGVPFVRNELASDETNIIVGYNLLQAPPAEPYIVWQLEQLSNVDGWFSPTLLEILKRADQVWDYAPENILFLASHGVTAKLLPFGYHDALRTIAPGPNRDIDVLFYGSPHPRRDHVLSELERQCAVKRLFGVYGPERDEWIARSKIVLNLHYYSAQIFEAARVSYLVNNGVFVVSEMSQTLFGCGVQEVPYDRVASTCLAWLFGPESAFRAGVAEAGRLAFSRQPMAAYLERVLK